MIKFLEAYNQCLLSKTLIINYILKIEISLKIYGTIFVCKYVNTDIFLLHL